MPETHHNCVAYLTYTNNFMKILLLGLALSAIIMILSFNPDDSLERIKKNVPVGLSYIEIIPEPAFENLKMIGNVNEWGVQGTRTERLNGKILRTLRFQNIAAEVEVKYDLPRNLILAMIIQETGGVDALPNALSDGGLGICHMQPSVATEFGLKVYQNSNKLVDKEHGAALKKLIRKYNYDRKLLIQYDDRFHPILNLDAVGRILMYYRNIPMSNKSKLQAAIYGYAGSRNYKKYYNNVMYFKRLLDDPVTIREVENEFNKLNKNLRIKYQEEDQYIWRKGDFKSYIKAHQDQNINYGLNKYK